MTISRYLTLATFLGTHFLTFLKNSVLVGFCWPKNYHEHRPYVSISSSTEKADEQEFDQNEIVQWNEGQDQKWPFHEGDKVGNTGIDNVWFTKKVTKHSSGTLLRLVTFSWIRR